MNQDTRFWICRVEDGDGCLSRRKQGLYYTLNIQKNRYIEYFFMSYLKIIYWASWKCSVNWPRLIWIVVNQHRKKFIVTMCDGKLKSQIMSILYLQEGSCLATPLGSKRNIKITLLLQVFYRWFILLSQMQAGRKGIAEGSLIP